MEGRAAYPAPEGKAMTNLDPIDAAEMCWEAAVLVVGDKPDLAAALRKAVDAAEAISQLIVEREREKAIAASPDWPMSGV